MPFPFPPRPIRAALRAAALLALLAAAPPALAQQAETPALTLEEVETAYRAGDLATARTGLAAFAEAGDMTAQYRLGYMMATGEGGPPDREGAIRWLEAAARRAARIGRGGNGNGMANSFVTKSIKRAKRGP